MGKQSKMALSGEVIIIATGMLLLTLFLVWWKKQWLGFICGMLFQGSAIYVYNKVAKK